MKTIGKKCSAENDIINSNITHDLRYTPSPPQTLLYYFIYQFPELPGITGHYPKCRDISGMTGVDKWARRSNNFSNNWLFSFYCSSLESILPTGWWTNYISIPLTLLCCFTQFHCKYSVLIYPEQGTLFMKTTLRSHIITNMETFLQDLNKESELKSTEDPEFELE